MGRQAPAVPQRQPDVAADADQMIDLQRMAVPVGHAVGVELRPVHLLNFRRDRWRVLAEQLEQDAAAGEHVAELDDLHAGDLRQPSHARRLPIPICGRASYLRRLSLRPH